MIDGEITMPVKGTKLASVELRPAVHYRLQGFFCVTSSLQNGQADVAQSRVGTVLR